MGMHDNFADSLAEEFLTDMADNFFGRRKQLENSINIFYKYVEELRKKESEVNDRGFFFNYLLHCQGSAEFFKSIKVDPEIFPSQGSLSDLTFPIYIPPALTLKGKFIKLVNEAYDVLQKKCLEYMFGKESCQLNQDDVIVYYKLIDEMANVVNKDIKKYNEEICPTDILHYFKRFNPEAVKKESAAGVCSFFGDECELNRNLAFKQINFEELNLKKYPELPPLYKVSDKIKSYCKKIYSSNQSDIKNMISHLKEHNSKKTFDD